MGRTPSWAGSGLLLLYRTLWLGLTPVALGLLVWRLLQGKEDPRRIQERLGWATLRRPKGPLVWFHAASVGELNSLQPVFRELQDFPVSLLVTTVTRSSAGLARELLPEGVLHQYVPIDHWLCWLPFRRHWRAELGVLAEAELWPEIVHAMPHLKVINARMSGASFRQHQRASWFSSWLMGRFETCLAQSEQDAERFRRLGAPQVQATGSTKLDADPLPVDRRIVDRLQQVFGARAVVLLASTHAGEEQLLLDACPWIFGPQPSPVALLIAPRHPQRAPELLKLLPGARLWSGIVPGEKAVDDEAVDEESAEGLAADVVIADCLGAMGAWIEAAGVVVIGGSFEPGGRSIGGHNPLEPVALGKPVVCGPDMANFSDLAGVLADRELLWSYPTPAAAWAGVQHLLERDRGGQGPRPSGPSQAPHFEGPSRQIAQQIKQFLGKTGAKADSSAVSL
ncbi:3-deoxy-D-manno-octulosonic acid transferase [Cyanobium sp. WAJ14-Wanaka]|uniref:3-deoxy-D-manno-octulosonic acid transferase n=1 Tax=Cyanobium sp. WAJ14-Wanaka TaxID=2823725 RepID=UPI0020CC1DE8|nr:glycosyltransferase N-terminal domain-containing protein [Cyanobium sp. WAJ14-Wanaka]MCP9775804.1 hypothetical protein [Cyanobium sp. WAJ14-Wanaka]